MHIKKLVLFTLFTLFSTACINNAAHAAQWGILPLPKNAMKGNPQDLIDAIVKVKSIPALISVNVTGWRDLEPEKEKYDLERRLGGFEYGVKQGLVPYFGISIINTVKRDMPDDLISLKWEDPILLERFTKLVTELKSKLPESLPYFVIGNEVDVYFQKHPDEIGSYLAFYEKAKAVVKQNFPKAQIGISVTMEGLTKQERKEIVLKVVKSSDAAFFTFYPVFNMQPGKMGETAKYLDLVIAAAGGKDVILQEIGFPSSTVVGSSPALQAEFYSNIIPAINVRPEIKMASIFVLHDLEPPLCSILTHYYGIGAENNANGFFQEFLCSLGVHDMNGRPKPAWGVLATELSTAAANAAAAEAAIRPAEQPQQQAQPPQQ